MCAHPDSVHLLHPDPGTASHQPDSNTLETPGYSPRCRASIFNVYSLDNRLDRFLAKNKMETGRQVVRSSGRGGALNKVGVRRSRFVAVRGVSTIKAMNVKKSYRPLASWGKRVGRSGCSSPKGVKRTHFSSHARRATTGPTCQRLFYTPTALQPRPADRPFQVAGLGRLDTIPRRRPPILFCSRFRHAATTYFFNFKVGSSLLAENKLS